MRRLDNYHIALFLALLVFVVIVLVQVYRSSEEQEEEVFDVGSGTVLDETGPDPLPSPVTQPEVTAVGTPQSAEATPHVETKAGAPDKQTVSGAPQPPEPEAEPAREETRTPPLPYRRTHIVRKDETLWSIAEEYYGSGPMYKKIVEANPGIDPHGIKPGQVVIVPEE